MDKTPWFSQQKPKNPFVSTLPTKGVSGSADDEELLSGARDGSSYWVRRTRASMSSNVIFHVSREWLVRQAPGRMAQHVIRGRKQQRRSKCATISIKCLSARPFNLIDCALVAVACFLDANACTRACPKTNFEVLTCLELKICNLSWLDSWPLMSVRSCLANLILVLVLILDIP